MNKVIRQGDTLREHGGKALGGHYQCFGLGFACKTVPVPDYNGQDVCGITVHFLPCDDVKVTTSCYTYGSPAYPIKEPIRMKEPKVCPR
ncbi:hypothetical protein D3C79_704050 [compost metagenome]